MYSPLSYAMDYSKKISVVMSTYNTPVPILKEAVESILHQTLEDFEFIIIDDGSTDDSREYLAALQDNRIRLIRNSGNIGLTKSLNIGLKAAKGKYIARMDSDDVSLPTRFEIQFNYMESHPNVIMCGSRVSFIGDQIGISDSIRNRERENTEDYRIRLLLAHPGPHHPTFFMRYEMMKRHEITYDENLRCAQDYGLCTELSRYGDIVVLDDVLVCYRTHNSQISSAHRDMQIRCDKMVKKKLLRELLGDVSEEEVDFHYYYFTGYYSEARISPDVARWHKRLLKANSHLKIYDQRKLRRHMERVERQLLMHTFTDKMSVLEKMSLAFRYVSAVSVLKLLVELYAARHN